MRLLGLGLAAALAVLAAGGAPQAPSSWQLGEEGLRLVASEGRVLHEVPGTEQAEAFAVDEEGGVAWTWSDGKLRCQGLDGELLVEVRLPARERELPRIAAVPGLPLAWVAVGRELRQVHLSGDVAHERRLDQEITGLTAAGAAEPRVWVDLGSRSLSYDAEDGSWRETRARNQRPTGLVSGERQSSARTEPLPWRAIEPYRRQSPLTRDRFAPIDLSEERSQELETAAEPAFEGGPAPLSKSVCPPAFEPDVVPGSNGGLGSEPGYSLATHAIVTFDDGSGNALYAAGAFHFAGGRRVDHVAKWTGAEWQPLGVGFDSQVRALVVHDDGSGAKLYAAGWFGYTGFYQLNGIARWNGRSWERVGAGFDWHVHSLAVFDAGEGPQLHAAGGFTVANYGTGWHGGSLGVPVEGFARWDGERWLAVGDGSAVNPRDLLVFPSPSGPRLLLRETEAMKSFDGASFAEILPLTASDVTGEGVVFDDGSGPAFYLRVNFGIKRWDGSSWSDLPSPPGVPESLVAVQGAPGAGLHAGGDFDLVGGVPQAHLARLDGGAWTRLDDGSGSLPDEMTWLDAGPGASLYAGRGKSFERWSGGAWQPLGGDGLSGPVYAIARFDDGTGEAFYLGGGFTKLGSEDLTRIARWDGAAGFEPLGTGLNGVVLALAAFDDGTGEALFAGGELTEAGGAPASYVARWDGTAWSALGTGLPSPVRAFTVFDDGTGAKLFAAGGPASGSTGWVRRWDGSGWIDVGGAVNGVVRALLAADLGSGPRLFAGGDFTSVGGATASRVAAFDGTGWSAVGAGFNAPVHALAAHDGGSGAQLYAGGEFTQSNGVSRLRVARWDGSSWVAIGSGLGATALSSSEWVGHLFAFDDGSGALLYASGEFATSGVTTVRGLARLQGSSWKEVGGGLWGAARGSLVRTEAGKPVAYLVGGFAGRVVPSRYVAKLERPDACPAQAITLDAPPSGSWVRQAQQTLVGHLAKPAALFVQGERVVVAPDLSFAYGPVALHEGESSFLLEAETLGEATTTATATLLLDPIAPELRFLAPTPGATVFSRRPQLRLTATDLGSGVVLSSLAFSVGGQPLAASCTGSPGSMLCTPSADLPEGAVILAATIADLAGNTSVTATLALTVSEAAATTTTVQGSVERPDGSPAAGAMVSVLGVPGASITALADGTFSIPGVATQTSEVLTVVAQLATGAEPLFASVEVAPVPGGESDAGVLTLATGCRPSFAADLFQGAGISGVTEPRVRAMVVFDDGTGPALYVGGEFSRVGGVPASNIARWNGTSWSALGSGISSTVRALAVYDDGSGPALYAGGGFSTAGGVAASRLARWDGVSWSSVGGGVEISTFAPVRINSLAVWDDGAGPALFAGGTFWSVGGVAATSIARWNGSSWSALGGGISHSGALTAAVFSLAAFDDGTGSALYAGGSFDRAGGFAARHIARWNGSAWSALGEGLGSSSVDGVGINVSALAVYDDGTGAALYAAGLFESGGVWGEKHSVARWDGARWDALGDGLESGGIAAQLAQGVQALAVFDDGAGARLYAAGEIRASGEQELSHLAAWDGESWEAVGGGLSEGGWDGMALAVYDEGGGPRLFVGGAFDSAGGVPVGGVARWDGARFSSLGAGTTGSIAAFVVHDDGTGPALYAGGDFLAVNGVASRRIARYDGRAWSAVGSGLNATVRSLAVYDDGGGAQLFAGGDFVSAGSDTIDGLAAWDGLAWQEVGGGLAGGSVRALAVYDPGSGPGLYATGGFTLAGGSFADRIARWDGSAWGPLGSGLNGEGRALAVYGGSLYAGGSFATAGGVSGASYVARWNGTAWSKAASTISSQVNALAVFDSGSGPRLIAAGKFSASSGRSKIAAWDGTAWSALGTGLGSGEAMSLAVYDDGRGPALYVGGTFTTAGGQPALAAARWSGSSWSSLGAGLDGPVSALGAFDDGGGAALFLGGDFGAAGGTGSVFLARWRSPADCALPDRWDLAPPVVSFTAPAPATFVTEAQPEIQLAYSDSGVGVDTATLSVSAGAGEPSFTCDAQGATATCTPQAALGNGAVNLTATVRDFVGNLSSTASLSFTVDTVAPALAFTKPQAGAVVRTANPAIELTATDATSGVEESSFELEIGGEPASSSCTFVGPVASCTLASALADGPVMLSATVRDQAGLLSGIASVSFVVDTVVVPDTTAPVVSFLDPAPLAVFDPNTQPIRLLVGDVGRGVDRESLVLAVDGVEIAVTCTLCATSAVCMPVDPLTGDVLTLTATIADLAGNLSAVAQVRFPTRPDVDVLPPVVTVTSPADGSVTAEAAVTLIGGVSEAATVTVNGEPVTLDGANEFSHGPMPLAEGANSFSFLATDLAGNQGSLSLSITRDSFLPSPVNASLVTVNPAVGGQVTVTGAPGAVDPVRPDLTVRATHLQTLAAVVGPIGGDGSFSLAIAARGGDRLSIVTRTASGQTSEARLFTVPGVPEIPADPAAVAPPLDPTVAYDPCRDTAFLYESPQGTQLGTEPGAFDCRRVAVIRGRVLDRAGQPFAGALVRPVGHPDWGTTLSRTDGRWDLAANGGGKVLLEISAAGHLPVHRFVETLWRDFSFAPDAVLTPLDSAVTTIELSTAATMLTARGSTQTDPSGTRRATLLFPSGSSATMTLAGGATQGLPTLSVRATEYTVGERGPLAMPGELPPTSGYTYAVELSVDEAAAAGATRVSFSQPVLSLTENFLNLPVGMVVPVGYYDRERAAWVPSENGRVIEVLGATDGLADLDLTGSGQAAEAAALAALGITVEEQQALASLYPAGTELWRVRVTHFTPYDYNLPVQPTEGAEGPKLPKPKGGDRDKRDDDCIELGSIIECTNQILGEALGISGTGLTLHYQSDRVPGRKVANQLEIPLSEGSLPPGVKRIELEVEVAGQKSTQTFAPAANQSFAYTWDGKDGLGRRPQGRQEYTSTVSYVYDALYQNPGACGGRPCFGTTGTAPVAPARGELKLSQRHRGQLGAWSALEQLKLGAWSLSAHHVYDPQDKTLHYGDGRRRTIRDAQVMNTRIGNGEGDTPDSVPADEAQLSRPSRLLLAPPSPSVGSPDGGEGFYVLDSGNCKVKLVTWEGEVRTVMGAGCGVGATAVAFGATDLEAYPPTAIQLFETWDIAVDRSGNLYVADRANWVQLEENPDATGRIYRITPQGAVQIVDWEYQLIGNPIAVDDFGALFIASVSNVERIDGLHEHTVVAGRIGPPLPGMPPTFDGAGWVDDHVEPLHNRIFFAGARSLRFGPDGNMYRSEGDRILRITWDGWVEHVAGDVERNDRGNPQEPIPGPFFSGDGCPANGLSYWPGCSERGAEIDAYRGGISFTPDRGMLIADLGNHRIRYVNNLGVIRTLIGTGEPQGEACSAEGVLSEESCLNEPADVLMLPDGELLIAEYGNHRVRSSKPPIDEDETGSSEIRIPSEDGSELYIFDVEGRHLRTLEAQSGEVLLEFAYDTGGYLVTVTDAFGNVTTLERDGTGNVTRITAPFGQETEIEMGADGYLASVANPAGEEVHLTYTQDALLTSLRDPKGYTTTFTYDGLGRLQKDEDPLGGFTGVSRTELTPSESLESGYVVAKSSAMGRTTTYRTEKLTTGIERRTITSPDGTSLLITGHPDGGKQTIYADGTTASMSPAPDPRHGMLAPILGSATVTTPGGLSSTTTSSRAFVPRPVPIPGIPAGDIRNFLLDDTVSVDGRTTTSSYDFDSRTLTGTTPMGRSSAAIRDVVGRMTRAEQPGITPVTYGYDPQGRLSAVTQGERTVGYTYNSQGYVETVTDPLGRESSSTYDAAGRVTSQTLPDGRVIGFAYDLNGNVTSITPPARPGHGFTYDETDRAEGYDPPALGAGTWGTTLSYNLDHQVTRVTRPDGQEIAYAHDPQKGRLTSLTTPRGVYTPSYHPTTGNLASITDPAGGSLSFSYDGSLPTGVSWSGEVSGSVTATYNNRFEVTQRKVNGGNAVAYTYNLDGQLTQAGALALSYDSTTGLPTNSAVGNVIDEVAFSSFGELESYAARYNTTDLLATTFTRDDAGRITEKTETIGGTPDAYLYTYDPAGRLTEVEKNGLVVESYTYDDNSNRTAWSDPWGSHAASYDDQDRLLAADSATYTYTANGELATKVDAGQTVTYDYDVTGQILGVDLPSGISIDYLLDAGNRRVGKKINGTLVQGFLYAGGVPVAELDGSGAVVSLFVYGRKATTPEYMVKGGVTYRLISDHLGSVRLVVNTTTGQIAQRLDYSAFGRVMLDSNPGFTPFGFAGGLFDTQTGLVRFGARDYDPEVGRWTARDPALFGGGDPNLWAYVQSDPVNLTDPSGFAAVDAAVGFAEGAVTGLGIGLAAGAAIALAPAAAPLLVLAGIIGLATAAVEGYNLFTDPCAEQSEKDRFLGQIAGGVVGGGLGGVKGFRAGRALRGGRGAGADAGTVGGMKRLRYEGSPKHGSSPRGRASAGPVDGQSVLDYSVQVKPTSSRRIGVDYEAGDFVVFDQTSPGVFHGHVRGWTGLTSEMQSALVQAGLATSRGRIE